MAFTYDHTSSATIAQIRDAIGDQLENAGPRWHANADTPSESNFSDEVLTAYYAKNSSDFYKTVCDLLFVLYGDWLKASTLVQDGDEIENLKDKADGYRRAAIAWQERASSQQSVLTAKQRVSVMGVASVKAWQC